MIFVPADRAALALLKDSLQGSNGYTQIGNYDHFLKIYGILIELLGLRLIVFLKKVTIFTKIVGSDIPKKRWEG